MAKLGAYFSLCPLIDTKNLLGISEDFEKGFLVVTLGKNISSRYKVRQLLFKDPILYDVLVLFLIILFFIQISDQKQISCWRTKEKFSSPVLFDKTLSKYVAVFNYSFIKLWDDEDNLDKVKKYKVILKLIQYSFFIYLSYLF